MVVPRQVQVNLAVDVHRVGGRPAKDEGGRQPGELDVVVNAQIGGGQRKAAPAEVQSLIGDFDISQRDGGRTAVKGAFENQDEVQCQRANCHREASVVQAEVFQLQGAPGELQLQLLHAAADVAHRVEAHVEVDRSRNARQGYGQVNAGGLDDVIARHVGKLARCTRYEEDTFAPKGDVWQWEGSPSAAHVQAAARNSNVADLASVPTEPRRPSHGG